MPPIYGYADREGSPPFIIADIDVDYSENENEVPIRKTAIRPEAVRKEAERLGRVCTPPPNKFRVTQARLQTEEIGASVKSKTHSSVSSSGDESDISPVRLPSYKSEVKRGIKRKSGLSGRETPVKKSEGPLNQFTLPSTSTSSLASHRRLTSINTNEHGQAETYKPGVRRLPHLGNSSSHQDPVARHPHNALDNDPRPRPPQRADLLKRVQPGGLAQGERIRAPELIQQPRGDSGNPELKQAHLDELANRDFTIARLTRDLEKAQEENLKLKQVIASKCDVISESRKLLHEMEDRDRRNFREIDNALHLIGNR